MHAIQYTLKHLFSYHLYASIQVYTQELWYAYQGLNKHYSCHNTLEHYKRNYKYQLWENHRRCVVEKRCVCTVCICWCAAHTSNMYGKDSLLQILVIAGHSHALGACSCCMKSSSKTLVSTSFCCTNSHVGMIWSRFSFCLNGLNSTKVSNNRNILCGRWSLTIFTPIGGHCMYITQCKRHLASLWIYSVA